MTWFDIATNTGISLATGAIASGAVWWWLTRHLRPKLEWSETIARWRYDDDPSNEFRYEIKLYNTAKRDAVDVTWCIRIRLSGLNQSGRAEKVTLETDQLPIVRCKRNYAAVNDAQRASNKTLTNDQFKAQVMRIRFDRIDDKLRSRYAPVVPQEFRQKWINGENIDLLQLLSALPGSYLEVSAFYSDQYSWARSVATKDLRLDTIRPGRFRKYLTEHEESEIVARN